jgi:hypothetical protein
MNAEILGFQPQVKCNRILSVIQMIFILNLSLIYTPAAGNGTRRESILPRS